MLHGVGIWEFGAKYLLLTTYGVVEKKNYVRLKTWWAVWASKNCLREGRWPREKNISSFSYAGFGNQNPSFGYGVTEWSVWCEWKKVKKILTIAVCVGLEVGLNFTINLGITEWSVGGKQGKKLMPAVVLWWAVGWEQKSS